MLEVASDAVGVRVRNIARVSTESPTTAADDVDWQLTPAQQEALRAAYDAGYFAVPRDVSADVVADELGISKSAFIQRLRRAEMNYFHQMLDME